MTPIRDNGSGCRIIVMQEKISEGHMHIICAFHVRSCSNCTGSFWRAALNLQRLNIVQIKPVKPVRTKFSLDMPPLHLHFNA